MKILFIYLSAFSTNGGIEKFNKTFMKALAENEEATELKVMSSHDKNCDERYISQNKFKGFNGGRVVFSMEAVAEAGKFDKIIFGHINLAPIGLLIKKLYPIKHLILITHGIEVWGELSSLKKNFIEEVDQVIAVSNFTKSRLVAEQKMDPGKIKILSNTIDPYFEKPLNFDKPGYLIKRYGIKDGEKVITTVCRLSSEEKYKGYDKVIKTLPLLLKKMPDTKYILVGKSDKKEENRVLSLIADLDLTKYIILTGFISDTELTDHYKLADLFVMPSNGEGFGIVYLESMLSGVSVITGNNDGSGEIVEKLQLGRSVDPENEEELSTAIISMLQEEKPDKKSISAKVEDVFGFDRFKKRVAELVLHNIEKIEA